MSTWVINAITGATSRYEDYDFDSFCLGEDGKYYGVKADGLYLLEGADDNGAAISAYMNLGRLDFGTTALKRITNAYATLSSGGNMVLNLSGYSYTARASDSEYKGQRFDIGKGLRLTYFNPILTNSSGCAFTMDSLEMAAVPTVRRI